MGVMFTKIEEWISLAREKIKSEGVRQNDLDQLEQILQVKCSRQRLLYLIVRQPSDKRHYHFLLDRMPLGMS